MADFYSDIVIIGAGVIGLSIAKAISENDGGRERSFRVFPSRKYNFW